MSGPLDPEFLRRNAMTFGPSPARFILEMISLKKIDLDADTLAILLKKAESDKPGWRPRTPYEMDRDKMELLGVQIPPPRVEREPGADEGEEFAAVEEREVEVKDEDEGEPL